jgi:hypothetical protein
MKTITLTEQQLELILYALSIAEKRMELIHAEIVQSTIAVRGDFSFDEENIERAKNYYNIGNKFAELQIDIKRIVKLDAQ